MRKIELQDRNGRIGIQFSVRGQRYSLYGLGNWESNSDRAKAEALTRQIEADVLEGRFDTTLEKYRQGLQRATKSLGTPIEMFAQWVDTLDLSERTYNIHYEPVTIVLATQINTRFVCSPFIERWEKLAARTFNDRLSTLRRFGEWLVSEGYLATNPYLAIKSRKGSAEKMKPLAADEVKQVVNWISAKNLTVGCYYHFLFLTGCRPSEAIGLQWEKVDYLNRAITIDSVLARSDSGNPSGRARQRKETKTGDVRVLPLSDEIEVILESMSDYQKQASIITDLVFSSPNGIPLDDTNLCDRYWRTALASCGLPYQRPYVTRHTAASTVIENGGTLADAAKLLGHRDLRMVSSVYGHAVKGVQLPSYQ